MVAKQPEDLLLDRRILSDGCNSREPRIQLVMRVLFIGGTGEISFDCVHESVRLGHDVTVFNRGHNNAGLPPECHLIAGDVEDDAAYRRLAALDFDVVCQFRLFEPAAMMRDIETVHGPHGPIRLHQLSVRIPQAGTRSSDHRVDATRESVLGILARERRRWKGFFVLRPHSRTRSFGRVIPIARRCRRRSVERCRGCSEANRSSCLATANRCGQLLTLRTSLARSFDCSARRACWVKRFTSPTTDSGRGTKSWRLSRRRSASTTWNSSTSPATR